jgi:hypothetical protein
MALLYRMMKVIMVRSLHSAPPPTAAISIRQRERQKLTEESPMMMFVFAAVTVTAAISAITTPQPPQDLTMDAIKRRVLAQFVVIVEAFIAQRQDKDALAHNCLDLT